MGFHDSLVPLVGGERGSVRGGGWAAKAVKHDMNFCNFFNLISLDISNKALLYLKDKGFT